jgi:hypothetical protein
MGGGLRGKIRCCANTLGNYSKCFVSQFYTIAMSKDKLYFIPMELEEFYYCNT